MSIKSLTADIQKVKGLIKNKLRTIKNIRRGNAVSVTDPLTGMKHDVALNDINEVDVNAAVTEFKELKGKYGDLLEAVKDAELVTVRWVGDEPQPTGGGKKTLWRLGYSKSIPGAPAIWHCVIEKIDIDVDHADPSQTKFTRKQHFYLTPGLNLPPNSDFVPHFAQDSHLTIWVNRDFQTNIPPIHELYVWTYEDPGGEVGGDFPVAIPATMTFTNLLNGLATDTATIGTTLLRPANPNIKEVIAGPGGTYTLEYTSTPGGDNVQETNVDTFVPENSFSIERVNTTITEGSPIHDTQPPFVWLNPIDYYLKDGTYDATYTTTPAAAEGITLNWNITIRPSELTQYTTRIDDQGYHVAGINNDPSYPESFTYDYDWGDEVATWTGSWGGTTSFTDIVNESHAWDLHIMGYPRGKTPGRTLSGYVSTLTSDEQTAGTSILYFASFTPDKTGSPPGSSWESRAQWYDLWEWPGQDLPTKFVAFVNKAAESSFSGSYSIGSFATVNMDVVYGQSVALPGTYRGVVQLLPMVSIIQIGNTGGGLGVGYPDTLFSYVHWLYNFPTRIELQHSLHDEQYLTGSCQQIAIDYLTSISGASLPGTGRNILTRGVDGTVLKDPFGSVQKASITMFFDRMYILGEHEPGDTTLSIMRISNVIMEADPVVDENDVPIPLVGHPHPQKIFQDRAAGLFTETNSFSVAPTPFVGIVLDGLSSGPLKLKRDKTALLPAELGAVAFYNRTFSDLSDNS